MKYEKPDWFFIILGIGFLALSYWFVIKGDMFLALFELLIGAIIILKQFSKFSLSNFINKNER